MQTIYNVSKLGLMAKMIYIYIMLHFIMLILSSNFSLTCQDSHKSHQVYLRIFWLLAFFGQPFVATPSVCIISIFYFHLLLPGNMPKPDVNHSSCGCLFSPLSTSIWSMTYHFPHSCPCRLCTLYILRRFIHSLFSSAFIGNLLCIPVMQYA